MERDKAGSVVDAVRSTAATQPRLAAWNAEAAPDKRLELRIGVNFGDVVVEGSEFMGDGVNIAADFRIEAAK
jgi:adenylate cyclase